MNALEGENRMKIAMSKSVDLSKWRSIYENCYHMHHSMRSMFSVKRSQNGNHYKCLFELNNWNSSNKSKRKINLCKNWKVKRKHLTNLPNKFIKAQRYRRLRALFHDVKPKKKKQKTMNLYAFVAWSRDDGGWSLNFHYDYHHRRLQHSIVHLSIADSIRVCVCVCECLFEVKKRYLIYVTSIFDSFGPLSDLLYIYSVFCFNNRKIFAALSIVDCVVCHEMKFIRACSIFQWLAGRCI